MSLNLNSRTIKSILENTCKVSDEKASKMNEILAKADLEKMFDDACPITSEIASKLCEQAADPRNLRLVAQNGELYCEASEFANFCEANNCGIEEAVEIIAEEYSGIVPGIKSCKMHVVFPQNSVADIQKGPVSGLGYGVNEDNWNVCLLKGCLQFGLKANVGVTKNDVEEEDGDSVELEDN